MCSWDGPDRCGGATVAIVYYKTGTQWLSPLQLQVACSSAWEGSSGDGRRFPVPGTVAGRPAPLWCRCGRVSACWGSVGGRLAVTGGVWADSWRRRGRTATPDGIAAAGRGEIGALPSLGTPPNDAACRYAAAAANKCLRALIPFCDIFAGFGGACRDAGGGASADGRLDDAGNR